MITKLVVVRIFIISRALGEFAVCAAPCYRPRPADCCLPAFFGFLLASRLGFDTISRPPSLKSRIRSIFESAATLPSTSRNLFRVLRHDESTKVFNFETPPLIGTRSCKMQYKSHLMFHGRVSLSSIWKSRSLSVCEYNVSDKVRCQSREAVAQFD